MGRGLMVDILCKGYIPVEIGNFTLPPKVRMVHFLTAFQKDVRANF